MQARERVQALPWVSSLELKMDARPPQASQGAQPVDMVWSLRGTLGGACVIAQQPALGIPIA